MLQLARCRIPAFGLSMHLSIDVHPLTTIQEVQCNSQNSWKYCIYINYIVYKFKDKIKLWRGLGLPILMQVSLGEVVFSLDIGWSILMTSLAWRGGEIPIVCLYRYYILGQKNNGPLQTMDCKMPPVRPTFINRILHSSAASARQYWTNFNH